jgi:GH15 family glucan-1,4-alpha-glucosidase
VWFTLSHGILDEIYSPRVDYACTRNFGLIVTDGRGYFSEEKRDAASTTRIRASSIRLRVRRRAHLSSARRELPALGSRSLSSQPELRQLDHCR